MIERGGREAEAGDVGFMDYFSNVIMLSMNIYIQKAHFITWYVLFGPLLVFYVSIHEHGSLHSTSVLSRLGKNSTSNTRSQFDAN